MPIASPINASPSEPSTLWSDDARTAGEATEVKLARLAAAVGPLRRVLAALAERCTASRAFERLGYARLSDYARERPGLSARQMQELSHVHRALAGLPALERALVGNALPWSKVRLVARVATGEDEASWIARARMVPVRALEQEVRASADGGASSERADDDEPQRKIALRCRQAVREKWIAVREAAERVAGERLREGEVLELVLAEAFSASAVDPAIAALWKAPARARPARHAGVGPGAAPAPRAPSRVLPRAVLSLAAGLEDTDAFEIDRRLRQAVQLEQSLDAAIAPLLRVVRCAEYEWIDEYRPLPAYARDELGMSPRKARALMRLERVGDVCPELREAYRAGRISWVKAQCLLPLLGLDLDGEWRSVWVAWAERVTLRRLSRDVERALLLRAGHHEAWYRCKFDPERAQDPIPAEERQLCAPDVDLEATHELAWRVPCDLAALFFSVRETWRTRLRAQRGRPILDGEVFEALLDHAIDAWTLREPGARRPDPVIERDGYQCAVPGCTSRRNLHDHHIVFRSAGGSDDPSNRVTLCAFHHLRGVHGGLLRVRGRAPEGLLFELGLRPGCPALALYASGDVVLEASVRATEEPSKAA